MDPPGSEIKIIIIMKETSPDWLYQRQMDNDIIEEPEQDPSVLR